jgi:hypothetical protein
MGKSSICIFLFNTVTPEKSVTLGKKFRLSVKLGRIFFLGPNREVDFKVVSNKEFSQYINASIGHPPVTQRLRPDNVRRP